MCDERRRGACSKVYSVWRGWTRTMKKNDITTEREHEMPQPFYRLSQICCSEQIDLSILHFLGAFRHPEIRPWRFGLAVMIGENQKTSCLNIIMLGSWFPKCRSSDSQIKTEIRNSWFTIPVEKWLTWCCSAYIFILSGVAERSGGTPKNKGSRSARFR